MSTAPTFNSWTSIPIVLQPTPLRDDLDAYRKREIHYPTFGHVSSRLPKTFEARLRSMAARMETTPSALIRLLAAKGAEQYDIDLLEVL